MAIREFELPRKQEPTSLELLGVAEVADLIHQTPAWVRSQTRSRCKDPMPHIKRGRRLFFEELAVRAWFDRAKIGYPKTGR